MPRILHAADFHLDTPFSSTPAELAQSLRRAQKSALEAMMALAERCNVDIILLSGDLLDSASLYRETREFLPKLLSQSSAKIFISPGNHDWYSPSSPYASEDFSDNVHIFTRPEIERVELPELGCAVYGAGFDSQYVDHSLLSGFSVPDDGLVHLMVMHGDLNSKSLYNPITEAEIASSGLDYLALGHVHTYSGVMRFGRTSCAYPGCPQGRGFDETGDMGVLLGEVTRDETKFAFIPVAKHRYLVTELDMTEISEDEILARLAETANPEDIVRLVLTGEADSVYRSALLAKLKAAYFHAELRDRTRPRMELWERAGTDDLKGLFISRMRAKFDAAETDSEREFITEALRAGLSVLENREEGI